MADATIELSNGTIVTVSGSPDEVVKIVSLYAEANPNISRAPVADSDANNVEPNRSAPLDSGVDLAALTNKAKDCEEAELIERKVLDSDDVMNRILMCLYVNERYFGSSPALTTGEISKMLAQLGVPIATANVSSAVSRKAKSYVMTDSVRKRGSVVRYSLNRRGMKYFEGVLSDEVPSNSSPPPKKAKASKLTKKRVRTDENPKPKKAKAKSAGYRPKYNALLDLHGLKEYFESHPLSNNTECVIVFYKFLTQKAGADVVNGDDIYTCFDELKSSLKIPGSFMNTLRNAQNRDHVIGYESNFTNITLTPKGENLFNHDIVKRERD